MTQDRPPSRPGNSRSGPPRSAKPRPQGRGPKNNAPGAHASRAEQKTSATAPGPLAARRAAYDALKSVLLKDVQLDHALERAMGEGLSPEDRRFAHRLVLTVLRHYGPLHAAAASFTDRGKPVKPPELHLILVLAMAQLYHMDVPDYAAVDTALTLAAKKGYVRQKGFANALLRKAASNSGRAAYAALPPETGLAPDLMRLLRADYAPGDLSGILAAMTQEPSLDLTPRDPSMLPALQAQLGGAIVGDATLRFAPGAHPPVAQMEAFTDGAWWVQDAASAAPVAAALRQAGLAPGFRALDICAAPGGKTLQLACAGAHVTALDISEKRMTRLVENIARIQVRDRVTPVIGDALTYASNDPFDFVILDAPCSATGTLRRNPDILLRKSAGQVADLSALQSQLIDRAFALTCKGGFMLYCTCSLYHAEGEGQIAAAKARHPDMTIIPLKTPDGTRTAEGFFRTLPGLAPLSGDGFFAALLRKD